MCVRHGNEHVSLDDHMFCSIGIKGNVTPGGTSSGVIYAFKALRFKYVVVFDVNMRILFLSCVWNSALTGVVNVKLEQQLMGVNRRLFGDCDESDGERFGKYRFIYIIFSFLYL